MRNWFSNLKFRYKLLIGMIAITTAALLLISQLSYSYFYKRNTREVLKTVGGNCRRRTFLPVSVPLRRYEQSSGKKAVSRYDCRYCQ